MNDPNPSRHADSPSGASPGEETRRREMAVYIISVAAELAGVHPQTLRIYERKGLLDPARSQGGGRRYSDVDIAKLRRIQELTAAGMNLEGVRQVLALEEENERLRQALVQAHVDARAAVEATHRQYRRDLVPVSRLPSPFGRTH